MTKSHLLVEIENLGEWARTGCYEEVYIPQTDIEVYTTVKRKHHLV